VFSATWIDFDSKLCPAALVRWSALWAVLAMSLAAVFIR